MSLAATRTYEDLRPLVFRDHALELQQQLIFSRCRPRRADKQGFDTGTSQLLDQQDLIGISSTEPIGCIDQHGVELAFGRQVANPLEARADQTRAAIAFVFEYPFRGNSVALLGGERGQRRRLAGNGPRIPGRRSPPSSLPAPISLLPPACVFSPGRMARQCGAVASCRLVAGAARASTGAARPGRPQEGPARSRRDRHESGGTARGRSLWTHRGERLGEAITPQAKAGEHSLMQLRLHANATTTPRTRAYIQKSRASHAALARELGIHPRTVVRWKARQDVADRSTRPHRSATSISEWEEALIVELRPAAR